MTTTTKPRNDWDAIRLDYLHGMAVREIGEKYKIDHAQIVRKAKSKGWNPHNAIGKVIDKMVDTIRLETNVDDIIDNDKEYKELENMLNTCGDTEAIRKSIIKRAIMQNKAFNNGLKSYQAIDQFLDITINNLKTSKDGLYTKGIGKDGSRTYGSYADDLAKVAIPMIGESNKVLGLTTAQVAIQNNVNATNNDNISSVISSDNVIDASRNYQDFIKSS